MRILTKSDVVSLLTMDDAITAVEEGFRQLALGHVVMPQRAATPVEPYHGLHLSMPAYVGGDPGTLSVKIVTVYGDNPARHGRPTIQGLLLLHDVTTGAPLALMDAEHLTAVRTGAASGVATRYLARSDASSVLLFGAGAQAGAQLEAMCAVRPIRRAYVVTRSGARDEQFCREMAARLGIAVSPCTDVRATMTGVDIICTATNARAPLFGGGWLGEGVHINAVGAYTAALRELDAETIRRARVFVDHHPAARAEAGDILLAIADGVIGYDHVVGDLGALVTGGVAGRTSRRAITVFKSVGLAMQDAVAAAQVYARAVAAGVGQEIDL